MQFKSIHAPNFYCQNGDVVWLSKLFLPITRHGAEVPSPTSPWASTPRFSFPLQSVEPGGIQLTLKDSSLWAMVPCLSSADPPDCTGLQALLQMQHSRRQGWIPPSSPGPAGTGGDGDAPLCSIADTALGQLRLHTNHLLSPARRHSCQQILFGTEPERLSHASLMNELLRCESLVHSQAATNKASAAPTSDTGSRFEKLCIL